MCLGLFVSALVSTSEKAMPFLVLFTMVQVVLSGGVVPLHGKAGLSQLAMIAPSRWGFAAAATTVNLNVISPPLGGITDPLWAQTSGHWLTRHGRDDRARGDLHAARLHQAAPPRPAPPQGLTRGYGAGANGTGSGGTRSPSSARRSSASMASLTSRP